MEEELAELLNREKRCKNEREPAELLNREKRCKKEREKMRTMKEIVRP